MEVSTSYEAKPQPHSLKELFDTALAKIPEGSEFQLLQINDKVSHSQIIKALIETNKSINRPQTLFELFKPTPILNDYTESFWHQISSSYQESEDNLWLTRYAIDALNDTYPTHQGIKKFILPLQKRITQLENRQDQPETSRLNFAPTIATTFAASILPTTQVLPAAPDFMHALDQNYQNTPEGIPHVFDGTFETVSKQNHERSYQTNLELNRQDTDKQNQIMAYMEQGLLSPDGQTRFTYYRPEEAAEIKSYLDNLTDKDQKALAIDILYTSLITLRATAPIDILTESTQYLVDHKQEVDPQILRDTVTCFASYFDNPTSAAISEMQAKDHHLVMLQALLEEGTKSGKDSFRNDFTLHAQLNMRVLGLTGLLPDKTLISSMGTIFPADIGDNFFFTFADYIHQTYNWKPYSVRYASKAEFDSFWNWMITKYGSKGDAITETAKDWENATQGVHVDRYKDTKLRIIDVANPTATPPLTEPTITPSPETYPTPRPTQPHPSPTPTEIPSIPSPTPKPKNGFLAKIITIMGLGLGLGGAFNHRRQKKLDAAKARDQYPSY